MTSIFLARELGVRAWAADHEIGGPPLLDGPRAAVAAWLHPSTPRLRAEPWLLPSVHATARAAPRRRRCTGLSRPTTTR